MGEQVKQDRAEAVNIRRWSEFAGRALRLFRRDVAGGPEARQAFRQVALRAHPFGQAEIAHQRFAAGVEQDVSRLEVAMQNAFAMRIIDRPRDFRDQPHALVRPILQPGRGGPQTPAGRIFHAEEGQAILALTDLVDRQDIGMIELRRRFRFAPEPDERLVRVRPGKQGRA